MNCFIAALYGVAASATCLALRMVIYFLINIDNLIFMRPYLCLGIKAEPQQLNKALEKSVARYPFFSSNENVEYLKINVNFL